MEGDPKLLKEAKSRYYREVVLGIRREQPPPKIPEIIGSGIFKPTPKRKRKRKPMSYEVNQAEAKRNAALDKLARKLERGHDDALNEELRAAQGLSKFKTSQRSDDDWKVIGEDDWDALSDDDQPLPEEKIERALMSEVDQFYAKKSYTKPALTQKEIKQREEERREAREEAEGNKSTTKHYDDDEVEEE